MALVKLFMEMQMREAEMNKLKVAVTTADRKKHKLLWILLRIDK